MAGHGEQENMYKEVIQGLAVGLTAVVTVVVIGHFVGRGLSHGPEHGHGGHGAEQHQTAPAHTTGATTGAAEAKH